MTEELKQAARQALEALQANFTHYGDPLRCSKDAIAALEGALTAAQPAQAGERDAWVPYLVDRADGVKGHYAIGRWNPRGYREVWNLHSHRWAAYSDDVMSLEEADSLLRQITIPTARASLPTPPAAQATPEPLPLGPLAKRNIYDAIRGAYDLGYNDARNARTVPGDSAPDYDGRSVEEDHGSALFNLLSKRLKPATPEPVGEVVAWRYKIPTHGGGTAWTHTRPQPECLIEAQPLYTRPAPGVPEIDYTALIRAAWGQHKYAQGTRGCVAFKHGVEWFRGLLTSTPAQGADHG